MSIENTFDFASRQISRGLGDTITWRPDTPWERKIKAVFGRGFQEVESGGVRVNSRRPEIMVALSDLPGEPEEGNQLVARGERFAVARKPEHDIESVSVALILKRL